MCRKELGGGRGRGHQVLEAADARELGDVADAYTTWLNDNQQAPSLSLKLQAASLSAAKLTPIVNPKPAEDRDVQMEDEESLFMPEAPPVVLE